MNTKKMDSIYQSIRSLELDLIKNVKSKFKHMIEQELFTFTNTPSQNNQEFHEHLLVKPGSFELVDQDEFKNSDNTDDEDTQKIYFNCKFNGDLKLLRT